MSLLDHVGMVLLAAGKGTRLGCTDKPKVMLDIGGKPMMSYIVSSLESLGVSSERIMAVVGFQPETIINYFGSRVNYAVQEEQLGTAHAAMVGAAALPETIETVCVLQGDDSAFLSPQTLNNFLETHISSGADLTLMTVVSDDETLGRVIRDKDGALLDVLEKEEVTKDQESIPERNTNIFCARKAWILSAFLRMQEIDAIHEFGIPQFIPLAREDLLRVQTYRLPDPEEYMGINTKEQCAHADQKMHALVQSRHSHATQSYS